MSICGTEKFPWDRLLAPWKTGTLAFFSPESGIRAVPSRGKPKAFNPDFHFSFGSANHRVDSDAFIYAGLKALKALRRSTPNG